MRAAQRRRAAARLLFCVVRQDDVSDDMLDTLATAAAVSPALGGAALGHNTLMVWLDQRKGGTVAAPTSEVYFETLWY